jgi:hypothetical protein
MSTDLRKIAAQNAACSIVVGILLDQVRAMRVGNVLMGTGVAQAVKVERWAQAVLDSMPRISSAKGVKNIDRVCEAHRLAYGKHWPHLAKDSAMSACAAIFTAHYALTELRRTLGLRTRPWINLDKTSTKLLALMLGDIPEEEARMFEAAVPVVDVVMEVAA